VIQAEISNLIGGETKPPVSGEWIDKLRPADGSLLCRVARSGVDDVDLAVGAAEAAQPGWAEQTPVARGNVLRELALLLRDRSAELSQVVVEETGKPLELALAETDAAVEMGLFVAGEGRRFYGRTTTASMPHRTVLTVRQPLGVAALVMSFNTPLPNVAWKAFPAAFCGNAAVIKPSEHTPASASLFGELAHEVGVPPGVLNVVQGLGSEAGAALVEHPGVDLVSFTGSAETGRRINVAAGRRLAKVCLELGGKNALVVCDDADLEAAVRWALASAFSNAGQRCASASRIVVFDAVYEAFRDRFLAEAEELDPEPVISEASLQRILETLTRAEDGGATIHCRGRTSRPARLVSVTHRARRCGCGRGDLVHRAVRPCRAALSRTRPRGCDRSRERLPVRPHRRRPHRERASRDALRREGAGGGRRRERRHARLGAAYGLRRRETVGDRVARGRG
jgi:aldehyde dehydrogenase (NAD+)